jgi:drug/metabolite transporter (DMT)-like permease
MALWLLLLLNGTLIAGIYACAKVAGASGIAPLGVLAWETASAALIVWAVADGRGQRPAVTLENLRYTAVAGVLGVTAPSLVTFTALAHVPAGTIGVIGALAPVFTYALAVAYRVERPTWLRTAGIVVGLGGVLALVVPRGAVPAGTALGWSLVAISGPLLLAAGNVYRSTSWPPGLPPLGAAALMLGVQTFVLVPVAAALGDFAPPSGFRSAGDIALWGTTAMMTLFYCGAFELQRRAGPVLTGQLGPVITVASIAIGVLFFDERYPASAFGAIAVVFAGVAVVTLGAASAARGAGPMRVTKPRRRSAADPAPTAVPVRAAPSGTGRTRAPSR